MQCLVILLRQVLSTENHNIQRSQVIAMAKTFPNQPFHTIPLNRVLEIALRENKAKPGPPKCIRRRQNQEMPVGDPYLYVVENARVISGSK